MHPDPHVLADPTERQLAASLPPSVSSSSHREPDSAVSEDGEIAGSLELEVADAAPTDCKELAPPTVDPRLAVLRNCDPTRENHWGQISPGVGVPAASDAQHTPTGPARLQADVVYGTSDVEERLRSDKRLSLRADGVAAHRTSPVSDVSLPIPAGDPSCKPQDLSTTSSAPSTPRRVGGVGWQGAERACAVDAEQGLMRGVNLNTTTHGRTSAPSNDMGSGIVNASAAAATTSQTALVHGRTDRGSDAGSLQTDWPLLVVDGANVACWRDWSVPQDGNRRKEFSIRRIQLVIDFFLHRGVTPKVRKRWPLPDGARLFWILNDVRIVAYVGSWCLYRQEVFRTNTKKLYALQGSSRYGLPNRTVALATAQLVLIFSNQPG